jgi:hypothetical protein
VPGRRREDEGQWQIRVGNGGWVLLEGPSERIAFRVDPDDEGRYRVREFHLLDNGQPVTAERLRAVRVGWLEQWANLPLERAEIDKRFNRKPSVDVESGLARFDEIVDLVSRRTMYGQASLAGEASIATSGTVTPGLRAPSTRGYSDAFYEQVAEAYRRALRAGGSGHSKPIAAIAAEADVPRSTAARWVKEARRRHKLGDAPATGKAGG